MPKSDKRIANEFIAAAEKRHGDALNDRFWPVKGAEQLRELGDDRYLSVIARCVFSAGFRWSVVRAKWPGFEEAFGEFFPELVAGFDDEVVQALARDTRIVRNPQKIRATVDNARFLLSVQREGTSVADVFADWPDDDPVGLWHWLKAGGKRLGGNTGPRILRLIGKDTFVLTSDVIYGLAQHGVDIGRGSSPAQHRRAQDAFVRWRTATGRSLSDLSVLLACSVDRPVE